MKPRAAALALVLSFAPLAAHAAVWHVIIADYAFAPARLVIHPGDTVVWTNRDSVPHTASALNRRFDSGALDPGASYRRRFRAPGRIAYRCAIHPEMRGVIIVAKPGPG